MVCPPRSRIPANGDVRLATIRADTLYVVAEIRYATGVRPHATAFTSQCAYSIGKAMSTTSSSGPAFI